MAFQTPSLTSSPNGGGGGLTLKPQLPSLDNITRNSTWKNATWGTSRERKRKRLFGCALSGLSRCEAQKKDAYFLTLTSAPGAKDIGKHWDLLVKRIRRELGFKFEYIKVETSEGNGVIHAIYHSAFNGWQFDEIHAYLSCLWQELHDSPIVWNSYVANKFKVAGYICQYMANQDGFLRRSMSNGWVWRGFRKVMLSLIHQHGFKEGIKRWNSVLITFNPPKAFKQRQLTS